MRKSDDYLKGYREGYRDGRIDREEEMKTEMPENALEKEESSAVTVTEELVSEIPDLEPLLGDVVNLVRDWNGDIIGYYLEDD